MSLYGFLAGFRLMFATCAGKERKRWSPELESLRGDVYMDGGPARCGDRIDRSLVYFQFVLSRVR